jgi:hypothetical protein
MREAQIGLESNGRFDNGAGSQYVSSHPEDFPRNFRLLALGKRGTGRED